jgi:hypothetical protein
VIVWRRTQEKVRTGRTLDREKSSRRRNRRSGFAGEISEIPPAVRSWRSCSQDLTLARRGGAQEPSGFGSSGYRGFVVVEFRMLKSRLAISRSGPLIRRGYVARVPESRGSALRGSWCGYREITIPAKGRWF